MLSAAGISRKDRVFAHWLLAVALFLFMFLSRMPRASVPHMNLVEV